MKEYYVSIAIIEKTDEEIIIDINTDPNELAELATRHFNTMRRENPDTKIKSAKIAKADIKIGETFSVIKL